MQQIRSWCGALLLSGVLVGCGSGVTTTGTSATDPLTFQTTSLPVGYVGEDFNTSVAALGGVGPYGYKVIGELPAGLKLSNGMLQGKPTKSGTYKFSIEANDANLSNKVIQYTLNVGELPPFNFEIKLPPAEIRGESRVPVVLNAPRMVRAARVQWDVGKDVQVTAVQPEGNNSVVFWKQSGTLLTVDFGFKTVPKSGARVALVSVKPSVPVSLNSQTLWYEARDGTGKLLGEKKAPPPAPVLDPNKTDPTKLTPPANSPTNPTGTGSSGTGSSGTGTTGTGTGSAGTTGTGSSETKPPPSPTTPPPDQTGGGK